MCGDNDKLAVILFEKSNETKATGNQNVLGVYTPTIALLIWIKAYVRQLFHKNGFMFLTKLSLLLTQLRPASAIEM